MVVVPISGKAIVKRLKQKGWTIKSQSGSHVKLARFSEIVIVPVHGNKDLGKGLVKKIEKETGVKLI
jgi:predicted RNA binding protein YcfA (HicA-like mRNA interferase family)